MSEAHDEECLCVECAHALRKENLRLKRWVDSLQEELLKMMCGVNVPEPEQRRLS